MNGGGRAAARNQDLWNTPKHLSQQRDTLRVPRREWSLGTDVLVSRLVGGFVGLLSMFGIMFEVIITTYMM